MKLELFALCLMQRLRHSRRDMIAFSNAQELPMPHQTKKFTDSNWSWKTTSPFSQAVEIGDQVFISGQQALTHDGELVAPGDIGSQTRCVFENMKATLASAGLKLSDLVRLNTYYVFDGADEDATKYWEEMTKVRLEYFPDPGPAATAVRIKGMPYQGQLIQIEGIALRGASRSNRKRIMPKDSWDWSIPVPLSQGWDAGDRVYVGGQISSDKNGASVHIGDLSAQTRAIYNFIGNVLKEGGSSFEDVAHIKICVKYASTEPDGISFLDRILDVTKEYFGSSGPAVTCFGVDLLYPGLDLEIDAMAFKGTQERTSIGTALTKVHDGYFSDCVSTLGEIWIGGQVAQGLDGAVMAPGDIEQQSRIVFERLKDALVPSGATLDDIVKLNLFFVSDGNDVSEELHAAMAAWAEMAPHSTPAMTPVRVYELSQPGLLIQADCIAMKPT
ncbi:MAG: enamine deaminase RidA (YjgF/YER057c/UK114 family) [Hyphomicrobiaceae bacterium]